MRQSLALGAALAGCALWKLSPIHEPEPFVGLTLMLGACALLVDLGLGWTVHRRATAFADELILSGFGCRSSRTPIGRALARRRRWLERRRTRHRLAEHLRWRLRLADGSFGLSPGYIRASVLPPLAAYERQAMLANYGLVREMADRLECGPVDPRALVLLWSVVETPPSLDETAGRAAGEELTRRLQAAQGIMESGPGSLTGSSGQPGSGAGESG